MFDQTIHAKRRTRASEDDDSDSESDDSVDEDEAPQSAPTPLPSRAGPSMMSPVGYFVPPTPTPAQGHLAQNRIPAPMVFSDENAVPPSASKPTRLNVFSDTPAKAPLGMRTPLASSTSRPRAFEAFEEAAENNENAPSSSTRPANNIFATPAVKGPAKRGVFSHAIVEEGDEDSAADEPLDHVVENADEYEAQAGDYNQGQWRHISGGFDIMTPITERTQEFTQMTNLRSSQSTNIFSNASSGRRSSVRSVYQDENEMPEGVAHPLDVVKEEDEERSGSRRARTATPDDSLVFNPSDASVSVREASGLATEGFALPEGYTIHNRPQNDMMQHTMVLSDRHQDTMNTMHTAKEGSPEPETQADTDAFVTANHGQEEDKLIATDVIELPNPCVPTDEEVLNKLLSTAQLPLTGLANFHDLRSTTSNRLASLNSHTKAKARRSSTAPRQSVAGDDNVAISLGDREFEVTDKIGEGGFGAVFLAVDVRLREEIEDADSDDEDEGDDDELDRSLVAIKVEKPGAVWEAVILDRILSRLDPTSIASIIRPRDLFAFADESYLVLDFAAQGTLLDAVNKASSMGIAPATAGGPSALDELVAVFFTIELLRLVETLHRSNFIHGDLKIDNCLVRLEAIPFAEGGASSWASQYSRSGENGWRHKGVKLIDFGRAIDLSLFPAGQQQRFKADWKTDERDCTEMREDRDWSFETDYFGLASICHCMLFGKYITTESSPAPNGQPGQWYKIATPLKRVSPVACHNYDVS